MSRGEGRSARGIVVAVIVGLVLVVGAVVLVRDRGNAPDVFCERLGAKVAGLDTVHWDNGTTESSATWFTVLTDGIDHASTADRPAIADAVAKDVAGYDALVAGIDANTRETLDRLWAVAVSGTAPSGTRATETAGQTASVRRLGAERCHLV